MDLEENGRPEEAIQIFIRAWNDATNDFEKFLAAHYVTRYQKDKADKLKWLETRLELAMAINNDYAQGNLPTLYTNIAQCYEELGDPDSANRNYDLAISSKGELTDKGPFYHGTKADLQVGDLLTAGFRSNYTPEIIMNHIYFTAIINGAGLAAEIAKGHGIPRVYIVEPMGSFENDPNVTDKKFPGNPTRSYRSQSPLKIIGEITEWARLTPDALQKWRERLAKIERDERAGIVN